MAKYLGLDLGSKTIGLAWSDGIIVSPGETLRFAEEDYAMALKMLNDILNQKKPQILVFGYPLHMNGKVGLRAEIVDYFIEGLLEVNPAYQMQQIVRVDERRTTKMAQAIFHEAGLKSHRQRAKKDSLAAQLILEQYLDQQNQGEK